MTATCGLPELLFTAALLLLIGGMEPDGALGAGGGMPAAALGRAWAASAAAFAAALIR